MPNANYLKGRRAEYKTKKWLATLGYQSSRTAGSRGAFDLIAWNDTHVVLLQVKSGGAKDDGKLALLPPNLPVARWNVYWPDRASTPTTVAL